MTLWNSDKMEWVIVDARSCHDVGDFDKDGLLKTLGSLWLLLLLLPKREL